ncbi:MAG: sugar phosphate isomerase/epimerase [Kiritimatiellae bacterium]|nr:sugar phosphate isomerase/epimerase [Kiritimatiellia bacterium]
MQIGLKLEANYRTAELYASLFAGLEDPLRAIRELGLRFIELPLAAGWQEETFRAFIRAHTQRGLQTYLHPYTRAETNPACFEDRAGNACRANLERVLQVCDWAAAQQQATCFLTLHGAENYTTSQMPIAHEPRAFYLQRSHDCFAWLARTVREHGYNVVAVSEHQLPAERPDRFRIGETFAEVLATVRGTGLGVCWDMGHAHFGIARCGQTEDPPPEFVAQVRHVHLHDIRDREDHRPLLYDTVPVDRHLRTLRQAGYDGPVNLELNPKWIAEAGPFVEVIKHCIERVLRVWA